MLFELFGKTLRIINEIIRAKDSFILTFCSQLYKFLKITLKIGLSLDSNVLYFSIFGIFIT